MDPFTLYLPSSYTQNYLLQDISGDSEDNAASVKQSIEFSVDKTSTSRWDEISVNVLSDGVPSVHSSKLHDDTIGV